MVRGKFAQQTVPRTVDPFFLNEAKRWIAFNTVTHRSNLPFVRFLEKKFRSLGFRVSRRIYRRHSVPFANFLARRGTVGRPLFLNTHLDTVPPGPLARWTSTGADPWRAKASGGRLYGLGTADVKLNLLCQWEALRRLGTRRWRRPVCIAGTFGEESGLLGAQRLARSWRGPRPLVALVAEPSEMQIVCRHNGYLVFEWLIPSRRKNENGFAFNVRVTGRSAHSSTPQLGKNALTELMIFLRRLQAAGAEPHLYRFEGGTAINQVPAEAHGGLILKKVPPFFRSHGAISVARKNKGRISRASRWQILDTALRRLKGGALKGFTMNLGLVKTQAAGTLKATFDVRFHPSIHSRNLIGKIENELKSVCREASVPCRLRLERANPALNTPHRALSAAWAADACRRVGIPVRFLDKKSCTEAGVYHAAGFPAIVCGPGRSVGNVHRPNESISFSELEQGVRFYQTLFEKWSQ